MARWSPVETRALSAMRAQLSAELSAAPPHADTFGARRLLRFFWGAGGGETEDGGSGDGGLQHAVAEAVTRFRDFLAFREEYRVDEIRDRILSGAAYGEPARCPAEFPFADIVLKHMPLSIPIMWDLVDNSGAPIAMEGYGHFSPKEALRDMTVDEYFTFWIYCLEYKSLVLEQLSEMKERALIRRHEEAGTPLPDRYGVVVKTFILRDLGGLGWEHASAEGLEIAKKMIAQSQPHYPEIMHRCVMLNAPWIFNAFWQVIKLMLSEVTLRKVSLVGSSFLNDLSREIPLDNIPTVFGGNGQYSAKNMFEFDESLLVCPWLAAQNQQRVGAQARAADAKPPMPPSDDRKPHQTQHPQQQQQQQQKQHETDDRDTNTGIDRSDEHRKPTAAEYERDHLRHGSAERHRSHASSVDRASESTITSEINEMRMAFSSSRLPFDVPEQMPVAEDSGTGGNDGDWQPDTAGFDALDSGWHSDGKERVPADSVDVLEAAQRPSFRERLRSRRRSHDHSRSSSRSRSSRSRSGSPSSGGEAGGGARRTRSFVRMFSRAAPRTRHSFHVAPTFSATSNHSSETQLASVPPGTGLDFQLGLYDSSQRSHGRADRVRSGDEDDDGDAPAVAYRRQQGPSRSPPHPNRKAGSSASLGISTASPTTGFGSSGGGSSVAAAVAAATAAQLASDAHARGSPQGRRRKVRRAASFSTSPFTSTAQHKTGRRVSREAAAETRHKRPAPTPYCVPPLPRQQHISPLQQNTFVTTDGVPVRRRTHSDVPLSDAMLSAMAADSGSSGSGAGSGISSSRSSSGATSAQATRRFSSGEGVVVPGVAKMNTEGLERLHSEEKARRQRLQDQAQTFMWKIWLTMWAALVSFVRRNAHHLRTGRFWKHAAVWIAALLFGVCVLPLLLSGSKE